MTSDATDRDLVILRNRGDRVPLRVKALLVALIGYLAAGVVLMAAARALQPRTASLPWRWHRSMS